jgi:DNA-binding CsgD family transcriptional regulator
MIELGSGERARMHAVIPLPQASEIQNSRALLLSGVRHAFCPVALTLFAKAAGLTASERDVLISLCSGLAANDIAAQRAVRISTIRSQIGSIREKVGARTVTQVIRIVSALPPMSLA